MTKTFLKFTTVAVLLFIFCVSFNSCKKDEHYNPERKIKRIYYGSENGVKYLQQEWSWDDNKLMRIDYYFGDNNIGNTEYYTYEKNKLVKVEDVDGYFQISYSGFKYDKIEYFSKENDRFIGTWDFSYRNNKISKTVFKYDNVFWINKITKDGFLSFLIPTEIISTLENSAKSNIEKLIMTYKYNGDNIKELKLEFDDSGHSVTIIYKSYDKMMNPFYKHADWNNNVLHLIGIFNSKNNHLETEITTPAPRFWKRINKFSYKYDKNFPIEMEATSISDNKTDSYKTYYEYYQ